MDTGGDLAGWTFPNTEYNGTQEQHLMRQSDAWSNCISPGYTMHQQDLCTINPSMYEEPLQHRLSNSTQSSFASLRNSNTSAFVNWQSRSSVASTNSSWSNFSNQPFPHRTSSLSDTSHFATPLAPPPNLQADSELMLATSLATSKKRNAQRHTSNAFATCVSRTRRSRRSQREPRFWCTSCKEPFIEKYDWKRHEETYQERRHVFRCNLCSAIYFLDKDFLYHHELRHNCETCQREGHLESAKQIRPSRSGWGCGFCTHFSTDWRERCNHVAQHFEKEGKIMSDWLHSNVINSLLQRPTIAREWLKILRNQPQLGANFAWNLHNTGRVEGYPENRAKPHLQDLLEYYKPGDNATALAEFAFEKLAFPSQAPQAPSKDVYSHHNATLRNSDNDSDPWNISNHAIMEEDWYSEHEYDLDFESTRDAFGQETGKPF